MSAPPNATVRPSVGGSQISITSGLKAPSGSLSQVQQQNTNLPLSSSPVTNMAQQHVHSVSFHHYMYTFFNI